MARILVIDDCRTVISSVQAALGLDGHEVEGLELLTLLPQILDERPPALILLDLHLPGITRLQLGKLLKGMRGGDIPLCIYSARPRDEISDAAQQLGAVATLEKGRPLTELRHLVSEILRRGGKKRAS
jgi:DNA-binding response OmpR family regulator